MRIGKIERFEDLIAWQKARELAREKYKVTRERAFAKDYGLSGQIQRAALSIMSNIAEGFERCGRGAFHQFLSTAKASCAEVRSQLYMALDVDYLNQATFERILQQAEEVDHIVGGLRTSVDKQRKTRTENRD